MNFTMLRWWAMFCSMLTACGILQYKGLFAALWVADPSGISAITLAVFMMLTGFIGVLTYRLSTGIPGTPEYNKSLAHLQSCWYASELLMALGMVGTLIGFVLMLGTAAALIGGGAATASAGIFAMASKMSLAVVATLTGLITSHLTKIQITNIETSLPDEE